MTALRLARGATGRSKILKFSGCYHGHADSFLIAAGSGAATLGVPDSHGVTRAVAADTLVARYNDLDSVERLVTKHHGQIAALIVEPVAGNMGVVLPISGFLEKLREITSRQGILLIFDEVITGFRLTYGGYQNLVRIEPDLTCLGKIIGGGLPVGAFGGRREIMEQLAPSGPVYQAGTLSGNPLAMAAGITTLNILKENIEAYEMLDRRTFHLCEEMKSLFEKKGIPFRLNRAGSMFTLFFTSREVFDFASAAQSDRKLFARYFRGMLAHQINLAPSQFEAAFLSFAHTAEDVEKTLAACEETLKTL